MCMHTKRSGVIPVSQKNLENWIQILSRSQMKCSQQPTAQRKKRKKKTNSQPSATQLSSLQFLVVRGHSISQAGCCRSGLRRINKFMWRKLAQHLPTICQFTLSPFHVNQILFFYLEDDLKKKKSFTGYNVPLSAVKSILI